MGTVYLIGAGPGDPGLLTVRGAELIARADVVVHDSGVSERVLDLARPDAERLCVGPDCATQEEVHRVLAEAGRSADVVVRLKVGDPFVFGRGGEEAAELRRAGVSFEVVPGVSAGLAAPAYAGIPVTHGGVSRGVRLVEGVEDGSEGEETVVAFMALQRLPRLIERLLQEGRGLETPAAVVEQGTGTRQRTIVGTLQDIAERAEREQCRSPAVVVVGEVVRLRENLQWFEGRPLFGRRVLVTRPRAQAQDLATALEERGAEPILFPTIRIAPPVDPRPILEAARDVAFYDWVIFTSVNGVDRFWAALEEVGHDTRQLGGVQVACIGPATAAACELHGVRPEVVPARYVAEAVEEALAEAADLAGARILLPRAAGAREVLPVGLTARGAHVDEVEAYRSVPDTAGGAALRRRLQDGEIDAVTFTSSSTVRNFVEAVGADVGRAIVAAIGPVTGDTAREMGIPVTVEATEHTIPGLLNALVEHYTQNGDTVT